jgi:hypothetical protein
MSNTRDRTKAAKRNPATQFKQPTGRSQGGTATTDYRVSLIWTDQIHVSDRELEVIELHLGDAVDQLLKRRPKARGPPR